VVRSHVTISLCVQVVRFEVARINPLWRGDILPSDRCGGDRGPMHLTTDDLWDVSRRGIAKLHVDWGGYRVPLKLPIDPDEAHHSDCVATVDMPLPAWGETNPACSRAT